VGGEWECLTRAQEREEQGENAAGIAFGDEDRAVSAVGGSGAGAGTVLLR
jgi:hypothetical protein